MKFRNKLLSRDSRHPHSQYKEQIFKTDAQQTRPSFREKHGSFSEGSPASSLASPKHQVVFTFEGDENYCSEMIYLSSVFLGFEK